MLACATWIAALDEAEASPTDALADKVPAPLDDTLPADTTTVTLPLASVMPFAEAGEKLTNAVVEELEPPLEADAVN